MSRRVYKKFIMLIAYGDGKWVPEEGRRLLVYTVYTIILTDLHIISCVCL